VGPVALALLVTVVLVALGGVWHWAPLVRGLVAAGYLVLLVGGFLLLARSRRRERAAMQARHPRALVISLLPDLSIPVTARTLAIDPEGLAISAAGGPETWIAWGRVRKITSERRLRGRSRRVASTDAAITAVVLDADALPFVPADSSGLLPASRRQFAAVLDAVWAAWAHHHRDRV
jgi:hypothetical protein